MSDLIDRQEAIDALAKVAGAGNRALDALRALPSAERNKGFWYALEKGDKGYSAGDFRCSICGEPNRCYNPKPNYCNNCGADMRNH